MKKKGTKDTGPSIVKVYEEEIEFVCPVRGKVKQKVKVKRIETVELNPVEELLPSKSLTENLDKKYSGLFLADDAVDEETQS